MPLRFWPWGRGAPPGPVPRPAWAQADGCIAAARNNRIAAVVWVLIPLVVTDNHLALELRTGKTELYRSPGAMSIEAAVLECLVLILIRYGPIDAGDGSGTPDNEHQLVCQGDSGYHHRHRRRIFGRFLQWCSG